LKGKQKTEIKSKIMSDLTPDLFQLDQVLSFAQHENDQAIGHDHDQAKILACQVTSCRKMGVAAFNTDSGGHAPLVSFSFTEVNNRAFWTRPFRRTQTWTQTEVRNLDSDSDSGADLRNRDFPTP
jgi:hypothetical protein